jgi:hypothetical protein
MRHNLLVALSFIAAMVVGNSSLAQELDLHIPKESEFSEQSSLNLEEAAKSDPAAKAYQIAVTKKIDYLQHLAPRPLNSMGKRIFGRVEVNVVVDVKGNVLDVYPTNDVVGNDQKLLLDAAIRLIKLAEPYPPPPERSLQGHKSVLLRECFIYVSQDRFGQIEYP